MTRRSRINPEKLSSFQIAMMKRPTSSNSKIVFPWAYGGFSRSEFKSELCEGRISEQDISRVLTKLKLSPNYDPIMNNADIFKLMVIHIGGLFLIAGSFLYFLYLIFQNSEEKNSPNRNEEEKPNLIILGLFPVIFISSIMCVVFCSRKVERDHQKRLKKREVDFIKILDNCNKMEYSAKDVTWGVGCLGAWIYLDLNFAANCENGNIGEKRKIKVEKKTSNFHYVRD